MMEPSRAVFLSYASEDAEAARRICEALTAAGIEVWFDQSELRGGEAWDRQIRKQVHDCALVIPIISTNTQARAEGYFRLEWKLAVERTHLMSERISFLVPVLIDDTGDREADVPGAFREVQWTRLPAGEPSPAFVARISQLLCPSEPQALAKARPLTGSAPAARRKAPNAAASRQRRIVVLLIAAVALTVGGYFAFDKFNASKRVTADVAPATNPVSPVPSAIPEKSIAVLPFVDMSEKHDQEYFSEGLSEELIDLLSRTPDLRVPARTSSFYFKGKQTTIADIGKTLGVAHVLEGSVRKAGNRLRVTAELIRADTGYHLWSETYDRELKDVFKVQDEIAGAVVAALKLKLVPMLPLAAQSTSNTEAYNEYLLARQFYNRGDFNNFARAVEAYRKAIALDPNYAAAYAGLVYVESYVAYQSGDSGGYGRAQTAADKAVTLAPQQAEGYAARGTMRSFGWQWAGAQTDFAQALALDPGNSRVQLQYGALLANLGRLPEAIASMRKATELDPLSSESWGRLAGLLLHSRELIAGEAAMRRSLEIAPESPFALSALGNWQLRKSNAAEALATFRRVEFEPFRLQGIAIAEHSLGNTKESQQALDELRTKYAQRFAYFIAGFYAWVGEKDQGFEWLEQAYRQHDSALQNIKYDDLFDSVRGDPRYTALLRKMNLPV